MRSYLMQQVREKAAIIPAIRYSSVALSFMPIASAQSPTLDQCYTLARANYPVAKQLALIEKTREYTVSNAARGTLPLLSVGGQATYQSAVTSLPIEIPNMKIPRVSKGQYKVFGAQFSEY